MDLRELEERLRDRIRDVADFPRAGIVFKDITPLLQDPASFRDAITGLCVPYRSHPPDVVVGIESRGFPFAAAIAYELGAGLVLMRKPGKLPAATERIEYQLEYGEDALEMHRDSFAPGHRTLVVDDVLATGGTARAAVDLVVRMRGDVVGLAVLLELEFLGARARFPDVHVHRLVSY